MDTTGYPAEPTETVTFPVGHAAGSAGSSRISPSSDWTSISAIAAVPPKLPSI